MSLLHIKVISSQQYSLGQLRVHIALEIRKQALVRRHNRTEPAHHNDNDTQTHHDHTIYLMAHTTQPGASHSLLAEQIKVAEQIANTNAVARRLAGVRWTDALLGRAQRLADVRLLRLLQAVHLLMEIEHQMRPIGDDQAILPRHQALGLVLGQLLEQAGQMNNDTVACVM